MGLKDDCVEIDEELFDLVCRLDLERSLTVPQFDQRAGRVGGRIEKRFKDRQAVELAEWLSHEDEFAVECLSQTVRAATHGIARLRPNSEAPFLLEPARRRLSEFKSAWAVPKQLKLICGIIEPTLRVDQVLVKTSAMDASVLKACTAQAVTFLRIWNQLPDPLVLPESVHQFYQWLQRFDA